MPKLRLLPPQFLLPSWSIQQRRHVRITRYSIRKPEPAAPTPARGSPPSIATTPLPTPARVTPRSEPSTPPLKATKPLPKPVRVSPRSKPSTPHLSLLEELFPVEAAKLKAPIHSPAATTRLGRDVPPLPLSLDLVDASSTHAKGHRRRRLPGLSADARGTTVMLLRNASKSLCEDDFRRVVPKGKHIDGWKGQGDFLKVIPLRKPLTLHQTGSYLLLFPSLPFAQSYQEHLNHLHRAARTHTPTSIESPLPPPPGYRFADGEDVYQLLQEYALSPPSQRLSLRLLLPPYSPLINNLLEKGGYEGVVPDPSSNTRRGMDTNRSMATSSTTTKMEETGHSRNTSVLFWIEGPQPSTFDLKEMIGRDGHDRGLPWSISIYLSPTSHGSSASRRSAFTSLDTPLAITRLASPPPDTSTTTTHAGNQSGSENGDDEDGNDQMRMSPKRISRWLIRFESEAEARRFVRAWNRRPWLLHGREGGLGYGDEPPLVEAEVLW